LQRLGQHHAEGRLTAVSAARLVDELAVLGPQGHEVVDFGGVERLAERLDVLADGDFVLTGREEGLLRGGPGGRLRLAIALTQRSDWAGGRGEEQPNAEDHPGDQQWKGTHHGVNLVELGWEQIAPACDSVSLRSGTTNDMIPSWCRCS